VADTCLVVIIPTFHAGKLLEDAILSVKNASKLSTLDVKIIVVDNSKNDADRQHSAGSDIYHPMSSNPGFGTAVNKGIAIASKKYDFGWVLLLNPDAKLQRDFFTIFHEEKKFSEGKFTNPVMPLICFDLPINRVKESYLDKNDLGSIQFLDPFDQFLVFTEEGKPIEFSDPKEKILIKGQTLCIRIDENLSKQLIYSNISSSAAHLDPRYELLRLSEDCLIEDYLVQNAGSEIHSAYSAGDLMTGYLASSVKTYFGGPRRAWCGAGVLLPRSYIKSLGGFDSSFFLYYEDTELSCRAISHNLLPILLPSLQIFHKHSALTSLNSSLRTKSIWQSRALFVVRTSGYRKAMLLSAGILAFAALSLIRRITSIKHVIHFVLPEVFHSLVGISRSIFKRSGSSLRCE